MLKIDEQLAKIIEDEKAKFESESDYRNNYRNIRDFLRKAEEAGLIRKHPYSIPQPDTIGKKLRESIKVKVAK